MQYQVIGHCANFSVQLPDGRMGRQMLFKGQLVPPSATAAEIEHHLSINAIVPLVGQTTAEPTPAEPVTTAEPASGGGEPTAAPAPDADGDGPPGPGDPGDTTTEPDIADPGETGAAADPDDERKQAEATAKAQALIESGSKPNGRHGESVIAEWLVLKGYSREQTASAEKSELLKLVDGLDS
jgi:hypothetical protein